MRHLLPSDDADFGRCLIDSARLDDVPVPVAVRRRILASVAPIAGTAAGASTLLAARGIAAAAPKAVAANAAGVSLKLLGGTTAIKCAIGGVCATALALGSYTVVRSLETARTTDVNQARTIDGLAAGKRQAPLVAQPRALVETPENSLAAPTPAPTTSAVGAPVSTTPSRASTAQSAERSPSALTGEVNMLDRVRRALSAGDGNLALRGLDEYQRAYPNGHLIPEATYLRVQALLKVGNTAAARDVAVRAQAAWPDNPKAAELGALVKSSGAP